jgi:hypothetical protein
MNDINETNANSSVSNSICEHGIRRPVSCGYCTRDVVIEQKTMELQILRDRYNDARTEIKRLQNLKTNTADDGMDFPMTDLTTDQWRRAAVIYCDEREVALAELMKLREENEKLAVENKELRYAWLNPVGWMSPDGLVGQFHVEPGIDEPVPSGYIPLASPPEEASDE